MRHTGDPEIGSNHDKLVGAARHEVCFDEDLISRYDNRGPRYTSYPTALQFDEQFTATEYATNAIASNSSGRPLSLYVHIPFCHTLCYYCACNKIVTRNAERVQKYMRNLRREIDLQSELFDSSRIVEQLHFGGGTPTYLSDDELRDLLDHMRAAFTFDDGDNREFSIEVDPRTVNRDSMANLSNLGFNRLSLGIQDFDERVQIAVNRMQTVEEVRHLVDDARENAFKSISFDLIYGLPHQDVDSFDSTLDHVIGMRPDRLAIYNYAHLPNRFKGQRMINDSDIPLPNIKLAILHHTIDRLSAAGYVYIGMDHFALPDDDLVKAQENFTLQRNFQGYSTHSGCDLIGLGVSSIGSIGNAFSQNSPSTAEYEARLEKEQLPVKRGIVVDDDDLIRARVIQELMCHGQLDFGSFNRDTGVVFADYFAAELDRLTPLGDDGLVTLDDDAIRISPKGRLLLRSVAMVFDRYLAESSNDGRFSRAI